MMAHSRVSQALLTHSVLGEDRQVDLAFWKSIQEVSKKHHGYDLPLHTVRVTQQDYLTTSPRRRDSHTPARAAPVGKKEWKGKTETGVAEVNQREVTHRGKNQATLKILTQTHFP